MKVYKKGTVVTLHSNTHYVGTSSSEEYELESDYTEEELDELAWESALETVGPEGWWELVEESDG